jgi:hypothetical protein
MFPLSRNRICLLLLLCSAVTLPASTSTYVADGAWCWFSDPRALCVDGQIYAGWMTADGSVQVGQRGLAGDKTTVATLADKFERDDHDHPALLALPDGRLAAFYALHAKGDLHFRTTLHPRDISEWTPDRLLGFEKTPPGPRGITYANPFLLRDEANSLYVFWRGSDFKPTFSVSPDLGQTWSTPRTLINETGRNTDNRPYVKYWSDGRGRIDILFTDGHPRNEATNSVYFVRYEHGAFWRTDGTRIGDLASLPLQPAQCDRVYDGATAGRAWIWSVAEDRDGRPVVAYTRLPAENDHRYCYARWDGKQWLDHEITPTGAWFPRTPASKTEPEPHYSGGMALDPHDPSVVYLSRPIKGVFEIERWQTPDQSLIWTHAPITENSPADNVRPVVVPGTPTDQTCVMWMRNDGGYRHYTDYHSQLMLQR